MQTVCLIFYSVCVCIYFNMYVIYSCGDMWVGSASLVSLLTYVLSSIKYKTINALWFFIVSL